MLLLPVSVVHEKRTQSRNFNYINIQKNVKLNNINITIKRNDHENNWLWEQDIYIDWNKLNGDLRPK